MRTIILTNPKTKRVHTWHSWRRGKFTAIAHCILRTEEKTPIGELPPQGTWQVEVQEGEVKE